MEPPDGYLHVNDKDKVCLLKRSLYGLEQSPSQWYKRFDDFMMRIDFQWSSFDSFVYYKDEEDHTKTYILLYVEDMLIASRI